MRAFLVLFSVGLWAESFEAKAECLDAFAERLSSWERFDESCSTGELSVEVKKSILSTSTDVIVSWGMKDDLPPVKVRLSTLGWLLKRAYIGTAVLVFG
jgi:hypothetical protein